MRKSLSMPLDMETDLFSVEDLRKKNEEGDASESETDENFLDAVNEMNVYVDGCCLNNGNSVGSSKAGIGVYWGLNHKLNVSEQIIHGKKTNNTAEVLSAIRVLEQIKENSLKNVVVNSDSRYFVDGITKWIHKWKSNNWITTTGSEVENKELWSNLDALHDEVKPKWQHIGREYNMNADKLAKQGAAAEKTSEDSVKKSAVCAVYVARIPRKMRFRVRRVLKKCILSVVVYPIIK
ncbi:hypothetical protein FSP39_001402 [Pinctada imbricata]|uniref:ribonuclease H n=1 Tax=Pinctada imbricata TaxID=66713 RepID=A0AA89BLB0_PINIB|nr:hypothetical protein FSP39_001402 [Pinctada imbricata]